MIHYTIDTSSLPQKGGNSKKECWFKLAGHYTMENEILKINILSIAVSGLLMLVIGIALYCFKGHIGGSMRFFLPIPPIGVAAYIYAFNMFKHYNCRVPAGSALVWELMAATLVSLFFFLVFSVVLIGVINLLKDV